MNIFKKSAFTLLQLIVVVVVLGILAGISIPQYTKLKERTFAREAKSNLKLIAAAERVYHNENGSYLECVCTTIDDCKVAATEGSIGGCNAMLKLDLNTSNWEYHVDLVGAAGFKITADRSGDDRECSYSVSYTPATDPNIFNEPRAANCPYD